MCHISTFYRHYIEYFKSSFVPPYLDHDTTLGRPTVIPPHRIIDINIMLLHADGEAEDTTSLSRCMINIVNEELVARNLVADTSMPCCTTLKMYNLKYR